MIGWRIILTDISQKKNAERELQASEKRCRLMFERMVGGAALLEVAARDTLDSPTDFRILECNQACERITGIPCDLAVGKTIRELLPQTEDTWFEHADRLIRTGGSVQVEGFHRGLGKHLLVGAYRLETDRLAITFIDITDQKKKEEVLEDARKELEKKVGDRTADLLNANKMLFDKTEELAVRSSSLEEANIALRKLIAEYEGQRRKLQEVVNVNLDKLIRPQLDMLGQGNLSPRQRKILDHIKGNLDEIASPMVRRWALEGSRLTPTEIRVAGCIRQGKTTKEIADAMGVSERTVEYHRNNIRKRLNLTNKDENLQSYLQSLA